MSDDGRTVAEGDSPDLPEGSDEGSGPIEYRCCRSWCDNDGPWTTKTKLVAHIRRCHSFVCSVCKDEFGTARKRNKHIQVEHDL